jgi:hypothetical protein
MMLPVGLVKVFARELTRLRAQETLNLAAAVALGSGTMKEHNQQQMRNTLIQQAGRQHKAPASIRDAVVAGMGIKVVHRGS